MTESENKKPSITNQIINAILIGLIAFLIIQVWNKFKSSNEKLATAEIAALLSYQEPGRIGSSLETMTSYDIKNLLEEGVFLSTGANGAFILSMENELQMTLEGSSAIQLFDNKIILHQGSFYLDRKIKKYPDPFVIIIKNTNVDLKELPAKYSVE
ncbi:MAG: hypothetical protein COA79_02595 [Planctomycetota bacterium]|nr:MAG: hypothetical protein COA79_02595 [Planctomycetota bacterium]